MKRKKPEPVIGCKGHVVFQCPACITCEHDYDKTHYPNNYDCPHFSPIHIYRFNVTKPKESKP